MLSDEAITEHVDFLKQGIIETTRHIAVSTFGWAITFESDWVGFHARDRVPALMRGIFGVMRAHRIPVGSMSIEEVSQAIDEELN